MSIQWFPGHMAKARNEIIEKIKVVDIVYVLLDARIPYSSSNPMVNEILTNKKKLYILTKLDMADHSVTKEWENYFRSQNIPCLVVDPISGINVKKIEILSREVLKEKIERLKQRHENASNQSNDCWHS